MRYDIKLRLIDAKAELKRMYPREDPPVTDEAVAVALYAHYVKAGKIVVATTVPKGFWEGPHVLRAMGVYLREPIYVWNATADDTAHAQQYSYHTFEMDNGDRHETGIVTALSDSGIRDFLAVCFIEHVLPVMMLLKHTKRHFYGVHHGSTFLEWHAKSGSAMRVRLDTVHAKLGNPILPSNAYDPEAIDLEAIQEEQAHLEGVGVDFYANGSQETRFQRCPS
ncbi:hypothetical protein PI124_g21094 [Phytophthora idaei]|nr:hypothetical protein PI126_g22118 [Phytophthora idaei]KAG3233839.1 hypothetical protein PI124_g21094 [Phytophthora idaei]